MLGFFKDKFCLTCHWIPNFINPARFHKFMETWQMCFKCFHKKSFCFIVTNLWQLLHVWHNIVKLIHLKCIKMAFQRFFMKTLKIILPDQLSKNNPIYSDLNNDDAGFLPVCTLLYMYIYWYRYEYISEYMCWYTALTIIWNSIKELPTVSISRPNF